MSVKVAVRLRPFNQRETDMGCKRVVNMVDNKTILTDFNNPTAKPRDFTFDYSFWSHDQFEVQNDGLLVKTGKRYADQQTVFDKVGKQILDNAWEGYHCCLFAYGQTGSGKSYSMVGYGPNKGIVPISFDQIFKRIKQNPNPTKKMYEVQVSMLEIYNEKIQDLLVDVTKRAKDGYRVREHKTLGIYVENLSKYAVDSYEAIERKMDEGNRNRTIASTQMNACSSRAHTIIQIEFVQKDIHEEGTTQKMSVINLVDLAGSEKISKTGATGDRMKEGCSINKSLHVLGLVIADLASKASGKNKGSVTPYRDSVLTRILQNALGGNSKTLMICALSPADNNYEETLGTLRYADQAKKIKCNAVINESESDRVIRELKEENDKLKNMLKQFAEQGVDIRDIQSIMNSQKSGEVTNESKQQQDTQQQPDQQQQQQSNSNQNSEQKNIDQQEYQQTVQKMKEMEEQLKQNAQIMQDYQTTYQQKLENQKQEAEKQNKFQEVDKNEPYLQNLSEDPILNGKVLYSLQKEKTLIGKKDGDNPDIILGGIGIQKNHAIISNENQELYIEPANRTESDGIFLNGQNINGRTKLSNKDRLIFGMHSAFLLFIPSSQDDDLETEQLTYEYAQLEMMNQVDKKKKEQEIIIEKQKQEAIRQKIEQIEEDYKVQKQQTDDLLNQQKINYNNKIKELEQQFQKENERKKLEMEKKEAERILSENLQKIEAEKMQRELEREQQKKQLYNEESQKQFKLKEKQYLENKLQKYLPKILEVNLIAKEMKRNIQCSIKISYFYQQNDMMNLDKQKKQKLKVEVFNKEEGQIYVWTIAKFLNRYYIIKEILDQYFENYQNPIKSKEQDPFWDPLEPQLIGTCYLSLIPLTYLMDNPCELNLVNDQSICGQLTVDVQPTDQKGVINLSEIIDNNQNDELIVEDPKQLLNSRLDFKVMVESVVMPSPGYQDIYVEYQIYGDDGVYQSYQTHKFESTEDLKIDINYSQHHTIHNLTENIIRNYETYKLQFNIYAINNLEKE